MKNIYIGGDQRGVVPVVIIYAIVIAMAFGGLAGLTTYLASDSISSFLLSIAIALVVLFSIPLMPDLLRSVGRMKKSMSSWYRQMKKELK